MQKQRNRIIAAISIFLIGIIFLGAPLALHASALSKVGSRGEEVRQIQQKLKDDGFYTGRVDGVYGSATKDAVIKYQKKNGLTADGICGNATLGKMGIKTSGAAANNGKPQSGDYKLIARMISAEARGEPFKGQVAVGAVILNRVEHPSFPDTVSAVLYQPKAFSALKDGNWNKPVVDSAYQAAQDALNGIDPSGGATFYYNPDTAKDAWIRSRPATVKIGKHLFCK